MQLFAKRKKIKPKQPQPFCVSMHFLRLDLGSSVKIANSEKQVFTTIPYNTEYSAFTV
jgi:hypothetical protein